MTRPTTRAVTRDEIARAAASGDDYSDVDDGSDLVTGAPIPTPPVPRTLFPVDVEGVVAPRPTMAMAAARLPISDLPRDVAPSMFMPTGAGVMEASAEPAFSDALPMTPARFLQILHERDQRIIALESQQLATTLQLMQMTSRPAPPASIPKADSTMMPLAMPRPVSHAPQDARSIFSGSPSDLRGSEKTLHEEVSSQLLDAAHGDSCPTFVAGTQKFAAIEIEGFLIDERRAFREAQRNAACKHACDHSAVVPFTTSDAVRLGLFLETVIRLLNTWEVQPGDWTRVLLFHVDHDVLRALRLTAARPQTLGTVIRYLRTTYPVSGAVQAMRILAFRTVVQGSTSVRAFYEELLTYFHDASGDFLEPEVTRQFVNHLRVDLRADVQREYDRDVTHARLQVMYQLALGTELRATQNMSDAAPKKKQDGYGYGKPRDHAAAAFLHPGQGAGGGSRPPPSKGCFNCGRPPTMWLPARPTAPTASRRVTPTGTVYNRAPSVAAPAISTLSATSRPTVGVTLLRLPRQPRTAGPLQ